MENPVVTLLQKTVLAHGDKAALLQDEKSLSYNELFRSIKRYAGLLKGNGLGDGDRVVIAMPDCPEFICAFLGCLYAGLVPVPVNDSLGRSLFEYILNDSEAKAVFTVAECAASQTESAALKRRYLLGDAGFLSELAKASYTTPPAPYSESTIGYMLYTSGSTGFPKGVPHYGKNILPQVNRYGDEVLHVSADDVLFSVSKLFFAYGLLNTITYALGYGATSILMYEKPYPAKIKQILIEKRPTILFAVPSVHSMLIEEAAAVLQGGSVRLAVSAGETLSAPLCTLFQEKTGVEILDGFGSTEVGHIVLSNFPGEVSPGRTGRPVPPWQVRLLDTKGREVPDGHPGSINLSGPMLLPYYWKDRGKSPSVIDWFDTGDMFVREEGGYRYVGRSNEMFKCDGNWVSPVQVEKIIESHPAIKECGVTGRKLVGTIRPFAYVVLNSGYTGSLRLETELTNFARKTLAPSMCPVGYIFCKALPRTETGKVQRFKLLEIQ
ncbi:MAG: benzoate-CoA ligase family protein [Desulforhopalus sp.]|nr:benzoate-CoA ligase family protein [Desulforhopalus sp.]